jgi:hypothetical protein
MFQKESDDLTECSIGVDTIWKIINSLDQLGFGRTLLVARTCPLTVSVFAEY